MAEEGLITFYPDLWLWGFMLGISGKPCPQIVPNQKPAYCHSAGGKVLVVNDPDMLSFNFDWEPMQMDAEVKS